LILSPFFSTHRNKFDQTGSFTAMKKTLTLPAHCTALCETELEELGGGAALGTLLIGALAVGAVCAFAPTWVGSVCTIVLDFFLSYKPMPIDG
jgi:hypothetical protein